MARGKVQGRSKEVSRDWRAVGGSLLLCQKKKVWFTKKWIVYGLDIFGEKWMTVLTHFDLPPPGEKGGREGWVVVGGWYGGDRGVVEESGGNWGLFWGFSDFFRFFEKFLNCYFIFKLLSHNRCL